jgi:hypothetical protein
VSRWRCIHTTDDGRSRNTVSSRPHSNRSAGSSRPGTDCHCSDDQTHSSADLDRPTGSDHPGDTRRGERIFD